MFTKATMMPPPLRDQKNRLKHVARELMRLRAGCGRPNVAAPMDRVQVEEFGE